MDRICTAALELPAEPPRPGALARIAELLWLWRHRAESRRLLAEMDGQRLRDIGLTAGDAAREARKPFWTP